MGKRIWFWCKKLVLVSLLGTPNSGIATTSIQAGICDLNCVERPPTSGSLNHREQVTELRDLLAANEVADSEGNQKNSICRNAEVHHEINDGVVRCLCEVVDAIKSLPKSTGGLLENIGHILKSDSPGSEAAAFLGSILKASYDGGVKFFTSWTSKPDSNSEHICKIGTSAVTFLLTKKLVSTTGKSIDYFGNKSKYPEVYKAVPRLPMWLEVNDQMIKWATEHVESIGRLRSGATNLSDAVKVNVLDLGTGTGAGLARLLEKVGDSFGSQNKNVRYNIHGLGLDKNPEMLKNGVATAGPTRKKLPNGGEISWTTGVGDITRLKDVPDGSVDIIMSHSVGQFLSPDAAKQAMGEIRRVLKPGGKAYISWATPTTPQSSKAYLARLKSELARDRENTRAVRKQVLASNQKIAPQFGTNPDFSPMNAELGKTRFIGAGLEVLDVIPVYQAKLKDGTKVPMLNLYKVQKALQPGTGISRAPSATMGSVVQLGDKNFAVVKPETFSNFFQRIFVRSPPMSLKPRGVREFQENFNRGDSFYLDANGASGFAVSAEGELYSMFNHSNERGLFRSLLASSKSLGIKKLICIDNPTNLKSSPCHFYSGYSDRLIKISEETVPSAEFPNHTAEKLSQYRKVSFRVLDI